MCDWTWDEDNLVWDTECGEEFYMDDKESLDFGFCPYCGKKINKVE